ncbi:MAG: aquaporin [Proteobacteria bacterium]|nr:aquaporin [Pseudomonadota bacterium]
MKTVILAGGLGTPAYNPQMWFGWAVLVEVVLTFLLVFAIFGTVVDPRAPKIGGFGVGLTIAADILVGGPLTGAAMNPARTFGPGFMAWATETLPAFKDAAGEVQQISFWTQQPVYWVGPAIGAVLAAWVYDKFVLEKDATAA